MRQRAALAIALVGLLAAPAAGARVRDCNITFDLESAPLETISLDVANDGAEPLSMLSYELDKLPQGLSVEAGPRGAPSPQRFRAEPTARGARVDIDLSEPIPPGGAAAIRLSFADPSLVSALEGEALFKFTLQPAVRLERFTLALALPSGAGISGSSALPLSPKPDTLLTDGRRVHVVWARDAVEAGEGLSFFALYRSYAGASCPPPGAAPRQGDSGTSVLIGFLLGAALVGAYHLRGLERVRRDRGALISSVVTEDEDAVLAAIRERGGEARQDELCEALGMSRPKLSKVVRRLEEKRLLGKSPHHRTNILRAASEG